MRRHGDRPFLCFVLLNDPHEPTTPPPADLRAMLTDAPLADLSVSTAQLRKLARWGQPATSATHLGLVGWPPPPAARQLRQLKLAIYDATIRATDRAIGELWDQLARWRLDQVTIATVFSDHGEEFLDHAAEAHAWGHDPRPVRGIGHGHTQFQELLHVPWVSWGPGVPSGLVWEEPTSLCDLAPTLVAWTGCDPLPLPAPPVTGQIGQSLAAAFAQPATPPVERWLLAEALAFGPDLVAVRRGPWKLIAHRDGRPLGLYHLHEDPRERDDRQHLHEVLLRELQNHLARWRQAGTATPRPPAAWSACQRRGPAPPEGPGLRRIITAFLIVRDEAARLPACLASLQGAVERVIVADTGSRDGTRGWLERMAKTSPLPLTWFDLAFEDFSQARAAVLDRVTTPWALWIDADERLSRELAARLRDLTASGEIAAHDLWSLRRENLAWGRPLRACGLADQRVARLLRVGRATFSGDPVHEGLRPLPGRPAASSPSPCFTRR